MYYPLYLVLVFVVKNAFIQSNLSATCPLGKSEKKAEICYLSNHVFLV